MAYEDILYDVRDGVATVTLNRPDRLNAWRAQMERDVRAAMKAAHQDDAVRVIVLTGAGRGFCAGADMMGLQSISSAGQVSSGGGGTAPSRSTRRPARTSNASIRTSPPSPSRSSRRSTAPARVSGW